MELGLEGKIAVVTGASKGIGKAIAMGLAGEGAKLAICARGEDELKATAKEIESKTGVEVLWKATDVTKPEDVKEFFKSVVERFGKVDILVNSAGRAQPGTFDELNDEDWMNDIKVKLFSMIRCSRETIPYMKKQRWGRIINVNAIIGRQSLPGFMATTTNRGSCLAFTKALSDELARYNILVNSVNIGFVKTPQWINIHKKRGALLTFDQFMQKFTDHIPLGRWGEPEEVANLVVFLASERSSYITGASIDVGGGVGRYI
ncbi:MAG: SDR family oxidoreductase [Nitrososphaerales archaeon]|nr:SDR family oxidoreductase [Nitrososphaerales archaeon]